MQADPRVTISTTDGHDPEITQILRSTPHARQPNKLDGLRQALRSRLLRRVSNAALFFTDCMRVQNDYVWLEDFLRVLVKD
jgi:hypothetical protein